MHDATNKVLIVLQGYMPVTRIESMCAASELTMLEREYQDVCMCLNALAFGDTLDVVGIDNLLNLIEPNYPYSRTYILDKLNAELCVAVLHKLKKNRPTTYLHTVQARTDEQQAAHYAYDKIRNEEPTMKLRCQHLVVLNGDMPFTLLDNAKAVTAYEELNGEFQAFEHNSIQELILTRESVAVIGIDKIASLRNDRADISNLRIVNVSQMDSDKIKELMEITSDLRIPVTATNRVK